MYQVVLCCLTLLCLFVAGIPPLSTLSVISTMPSACAFSSLPLLGQENVTFRPSSSAGASLWSGWTLSLHPVRSERCQYTAAACISWKHVKTSHIVFIFVFCHHCLLRALLCSQKVFISIKGIYYQAEVMGQLVTWLVPYQFAHDVSK